MYSRTSILENLFLKLEERESARERERKILLTHAYECYVVAIMAVLNATWNFLMTFTSANCAGNDERQGEKLRAPSGGHPRRSLHYWPFLLACLGYTRGACTGILHYNAASSLPPLQIRGLFDGVGERPPRRRTIRRQV